MSPDPSDGSYDPGNPQSLNRYSYVLNSPLRSIDPEGLDCLYFNSDGTGLEGGSNGIDHFSSPDVCGATGGDWVNGTTSVGQVHYNALSDNFNVYSSDGDNDYQTGVKAPYSVDGGAMCYGNCTQSYSPTSNIQTISSSVQQQFIPALAQTSVAFNRAIPLPCGVGGNAGVNLGPFRWGFDASTNKGLRSLLSLRIARNGGGSASLNMKNTSLSGSVSFRIPENPLLSVNLGTSGGGITSVGVGVQAKTGQASLYVATGNMQEGCHP
jgi:hypothetical protein